MKLVLFPRLRCRLWRKRNSCRLFYWESSIYGNSVILREVRKILPGIYRISGAAWYVDMEGIEKFFERKAW